VKYLGSHDKGACYLGRLGIGGGFIGGNAGVPGIIQHGLHFP
jgi:hypothetical protein